MPSILRHRLPSTYGPLRLPGHSNSCNRAKIISQFNPTNCLQRLRKPQCLDVEWLPNHIRSCHVCDVSLVGPRANGFFSNCNRTHTQTVQAKPPKKTEILRIFHIFLQRSMSRETEHVSRNSPPFTRPVDMRFSAGNYPLSQGSHTQRLWSKMKGHSGKRSGTACALPRFFNSACPPKKSTMQRSTDRKPSSFSYCCGNCDMSQTRSNQDT